MATAFRKPEVAVVLAMLERADPAVITETERALRIRVNGTRPLLRPPPRDLQPLTRVLLTKGALVGTAPRLDRSTYDRVRPLSSLDSAQIIEQYGSWKGACELAYGVRSLDRPATARSERVGAAPRTPYTPQEVRVAIRHCSEKLGRRPTGSDYQQWSRVARAHARQHGRYLRLPSARSILRLYPRWKHALADAAVTDDFIADARSRWNPDGDLGDSFLPEPLSVRLETVVDAWEAIVDDKARRSRAAGGELGALLLGEAVILGCVLQGSLDWLAGRTHDPGTPASPLADFDPLKFSARRKKRGLAEQRAIEVLGLPIGACRRILRGTLEPTLAQVSTLASLIDCSIDAITTEASVPFNQSVFPTDQSTRLGH
jgi:hypothetical protein